MPEMIKAEVENKELCRKCGGVCCKNMACHFSPDDFPEITFNALKAEIEKGHISIDCWEGDIDEKKNYYGRFFI
jgi:hypothetical protein